MKKKIAVSHCGVDTIQLQKNGDHYRFVVPDNPWVISEGAQVSVISPEVDVESDTASKETYKVVKIQHKDKDGKVREGWIPVSYLKD